MNATNMVVAIMTEEIPTEDRIAMLSDTLAGSTSIPLGSLTHVCYLMVQRHPHGPVDVAVIHTKERGKKAKWKLIQKGTVRQGLNVGRDEC